MTATTGLPLTTPAGGSAAPALQGVSHLSLSVPDLAAAADFWATVLGFETMGGGPDHCLLLHRAARVAVVVADHGGTVRGPFDEHHAGLDHVALAVSDLDTLRAWERRLAEHEVPYTPISASEAGHHLNLRAPGGIPVELCVLDAAFLAALDVDGPAAGTH